MKQFLGLIAIILLACTSKLASQHEAQAATTAQIRFHCDGDTSLINSLLMSGYKSGINDILGKYYFIAR